MQFHLFTSVSGFSKKSGKIKTEFKHENIHTNLDVDFNFTGPTVFGSAVVGLVCFKMFVNVLMLKYIFNCINSC